MIQMKKATLLDMVTEIPYHLEDYAGKHNVEFNMGRQGGVHSQLVLGHEGSQRQTKQLSAQDIDKKIKDLEQKSMSTIDAGLNFRLVSRAHAKLKYDSEKGLWLLKDESTNGTLVNDHILSPGEYYELKDGDFIYLGGKKLDFFTSPPKMISFKKEDSYGPLAFILMSD